MKGLLKVLPVGLQKALLASDDDIVKGPKLSLSLYACVFAFVLSVGYNRFIWLLTLSLSHSLTHFSLSLS